MATEYDYKGKAITGTGSSAKKGHEAKKSGEHYLNTDTGHVYRSTKKGKKDEKIWKYTKTTIIGKPNGAVKALYTPTRDANGSHVIRAKWKENSSLRKDTDGHRMTGYHRVWTINYSKGGKSKKFKIASDLGASTLESIINLNSFTCNGKSYDRDDFYPVGKRFLKSVSCTVYPKNSEGNGKASTTTYKFNKPIKPSISAPTFNVENGHISYTITTNAGNGSYEREDTYYTMTVLDTRVSKKEKVIDSCTGSTQSTSKTIEYDIRDYMQMSYDNYIRIIVKAWARGYKGDSDVVTRKDYIAYPKQAVIGTPNISAETSEGKCVVPITVNQTDAHPVDGVKLEYLANVEYARASDIPSGADWSDTGIVDDGECTALSVSVADLVPSRGNYTWLRVKSWRFDEGRLYRYSGYKSILHKAAPTASDDDIVIISAVPSDGGKGIDVHLGWNADGQDDSTGTELSWSDELNSWKSTKEPDTYTFEWSDGRYPETGTIQYHDSATITIKGLEEGETYYIKARRYLESDIGTSWSQYSDYVAASTNEAPESIVAICDKYVTVGASLPVYWTFAGNGVQTKWIIQQRTTNSTADVQEGEEFIELEQGEGATGFASIDASKIASHAIDGYITIRVGASTGSDYKWSDWNIVGIRTIPTLQIGVTSPLTVQPFGFTATASTPCNLLVIVSSNGTVSEFPDGKHTQTANDTIWSDIVTPDWSENEGTNTATITLPIGLDFWDGANYTITVTGIDTDTGLNTEPAVATFAVAWAHQAVSPRGDYTLTSDVEIVEDKLYYTRTGEGTEQSPYVYTVVDDPDVSEISTYYEVPEFVKLTPIDETDDDGNHRKAVQIELTPPTNSRSDDVYDVYRLNGDGAQLIGSGLPLTHTTADEYAPFGDGETLYYRVAIRTVDGDEEYDDFEYSADGDYLRIDWDGYYFESRYSVSVSDSYQKSVDIRQHMDGSVDGYWNSNIMRKGSLSTDVIELIQPEQVARARQLGRYAGVAFVRTPDGSAYEADVQVTDLSHKNEAVATIAIDATEVGLTQEFMLPLPTTDEGA